MTIEQRIFQALRKGYGYMRELIEHCYASRSRLMTILKRLVEQGKVIRERVHSGERGRPRYKYVMVEA